MPAGPVGSVWASGTWSDLAWEENVWADIGAIVGNTILDINTRISVFLRTFYGTTHPDVGALIVKYLREQCTGEYTARLRKLIEDATA